MKSASTGMLLAVLSVAACDDSETDPEGTGANGAGAGASTGNSNTSGGPGGTTTGTASTGSGTSTGNTSSTGTGQGGAPPAVESWFSADFNDANENGSNLYNFANRFGQDFNDIPGDTFWEHTHTEDQGWLGSPAPHVTVFGCEGCNTSEHQWYVGWTTPPVGGTHAQGESVFIRYRIKFDPGSMFIQEQLGAKFILYGQSGGTPNSRWIIHLYPPMDNNGCTLGFDYSYMKDGYYPADWIWVEPEDWGFNNFNSPSPYASFQSNVNIGWSCNPAILVTASDHPAPVPKPQNRGDAAVDGWTHLQFEAIPNPEDTITFRTWANNNDQTMPSSERVGMIEGLGTTGWDGGVHVGGFWGIGEHPDVGFIIDDFEIGPYFDPNWAQ